MTKYWVRIPFTGSVTVEVDADTPENAEKLAWDKADFIIVPQDESIVGDIEVETHKRTCYGNVCSAVCREIEVDEAS